jgi:hypothetical protein
MYDRAPGPGRRRGQAAADSCDTWNPGCRAAVSAPVPVLRLLLAGVGKQFALVLAGELGREVRIHVHGLLLPVWGGPAFGLTRQARLSGGARGRGRITPSRALLRKG